MKLEMTDTEKLNKLIDYIRDAEHSHIDNAKRGITESCHKISAIQDIQIFMEKELDIEYIQLPSRVSSDDYTYYKGNLEYE